MGWGGGRVVTVALMLIQSVVKCVECVVKYNNKK